MRLSRACVPLLAGLFGCGSAPPPDVTDAALSRSSAAGHAAYLSGRVEDAVFFFERALERARLRDDATEIGNAAYNLAACLVELGRHDAAERRLLEAQTALARAGEPLADVLLVRAKNAFLAGDDETVREFLASLRSDEDATPAHRAGMRLLEGRLAAATGDAAAARAALDEALALLGEHLDETHHAGLLALAGRIHELVEDPSTAARLYDREVDALREARRYHAMAAALGRAAAAHARANQPEEAAARWLRAARSQLAANDAQAARRCAERALEHARGPLEIGARELLEEVQRRTPSATDATTDR